MKDFSQAFAGVGMCSVAVFAFNGGHNITGAICLCLGALCLIDWD